MDTVEQLGTAPRPATAFEFGSQHRLRLHAGRYRVHYDVDDAAGTITVIHLGRVGG